MNHDGSIVIAGAGVAGLAAAITSARSGSNTLLIEKSPLIGGTVTQSLIHSFGGLYNSNGDIINDGLSKEFEERLRNLHPLVRKRRLGKLWTLTVPPEEFERLMEKWVSEESHITLLRESSIRSVILKAGTAIKVEISRGRKTFSVVPKALIDATGNADIIRMIDPDLVMDSQEKAAAGLIFVVRGIKNDALKFPKNVALTRTIRKAVEAGALSPGCGRAWIDSGTMRDEAYIKLHVLSDGIGREPGKENEEEALEIRDELFSFLKTISDFDKATLFKTGHTGVRDGGRIKGEHILTETDVREFTKFEDPACRCCWPIEYWDREKGVIVEYLKDNEYYEVPLRSLKVMGLNNVWAVGKCLAADIKAQASARVVGCCWAMGHAVGRTISGN